MKKMKIWVTMKIVPLLVAALISVVVSSCATFSSLNAIDTGTAVTAANFHYIGSVEGSASSTYLFGLFGGNNTGKAIEEAKKKANLKDNQALTNVSVVNTQKILFGIIIVVETTVSADIIEFR